MQACLGTTGTGLPSSSAPAVEQSQPIVDQRTPNPKPHFAYFLPCRRSALPALALAALLALAAPALADDASPAGPAGDPTSAPALKYAVLMSGGSSVDDSKNVAWGSYHITITGAGACARAPAGAACLLLCPPAVLPALS